MIRSVLAGAFLLLAHTIAAAQTPASTLIVLNKEDATLAVVDPSSGKVLGRVPTGEGPHEVAVSSDGKAAFVGNYGTGPNPGRTISVIDLVGMKELRRVDLGALQRPHGVFFHDGKLFFTAEANKLIGRYDPAANKIDWLMGTGQNTTHMVYVVGDGSRIVTSNIGSDSLSILERSANAANWNATVVPVGKGPEGFDLSPDGKEIWAAHSQDGGVSIVDVATKRVTQTLNLGTKRSNRLKFTPDGRLVLVSDITSNQVVVLDAPSRREIKRLQVGKSPEGILIPPTGGRAYVAVNGDNYIAVIDLKTFAETSRIMTGTGPDGMAWAERK